MKTIFIIVQSGFMARFLLRSEVLENLKKFCRIVILSSNSHEKYFKEEFEGENVIVEALRYQAYREYEKKHHVAFFIKKLRWYTLPFSPTSKLRRKFFLKNAMRNRKLSGILTALLVQIFAFVVEHFKPIRELFLRIECRLFSPCLHKDLFESYKPSAIIVSSLGYLLYDHFIMREAEKMGVKSIATLLSWDNTTAKGLKGAQADSIIAWTESMKAEVIRHHDEIAANISVVGIPHFDLYFRKSQLNREEFLEKYSLCPEKKTILYATRSPNRYPWNSVIIRQLIEAIEQERFAYPAQLLVRVHPLHFQFRRGGLRYEHIINEYKEIERQNERAVRFVYPQILSDVLKCDMPYSEMESLRQMLCFCDVMLCNYSTMMIEASIFDLPFINIAIYGHNSEIILKNFADQFVHLRRMKDAGKAAYSFDEIIQGVNDYLLDGEKDRVKRKAVVDAECGPFRGNAGRKFAEIIAGQL